jgi:hypothetical protein
MAIVISPSGRRFDRNKPDPLPAHRMLSRVSPSLPNVADLRTWDGPIKQQGDEGFCTGNAGAETREWITRKYFPSLGPLIFSAQYTYAKELIAQGDFPQDDGSDGTTLCGTLVVNGCCEESLYPSIPGKILKPTPEQDANAAKYTLGAWHGLTGSRVAISVLGDPVPWPVMMGFDVAASLESDEVAETGIYNPKPEEEIIGGHEVKASGYDIGPTPTIRPKNCPPAILYQNSWGPKWGLKGYFWCVLSVLDLPDTDLRIAHSGGPWK